MMIYNAVHDKSLFVYSGGLDNCDQLYVKEYCYGPLAVIHHTATTAVVVAELCFIVRKQRHGSRIVRDFKPLNVYGQTKLEGELSVSENLDKYFIVRIAQMFRLNDKNFIKNMINIGKTYDEVSVVNYQIGTFT